MEPSGISSLTIVSITAEEKYEVTKSSLYRRIKPNKGLSLTVLVGALLSEKIAPPLSAK